MDKVVRHAVRSYLIKDGKIVVINYKQLYSGYYDIPGGKIEDGETPEQTSVREFKEETGMTIIKQHYIGHNTIEYSDKIFEFEIFIVDEYDGIPLEFEKNNAMWINIDDLLKKSKLFPSINVIDYLKDGMNLRLICDDNHNILEFDNGAKGKK